MRRPVVLALAGVTGLAVAVVPALAATYTVTTPGNFFDPNPVRVKPGSTVHWQATSAHTVQFDGEEEVHSLAGDGYTREFPSEGTFPYRCTIHQGMTASVVVDPNAPDPPATTTTTTTTTPGTTTTTTTTTPTQTVTQTTTEPTTTLPQETAPPLEVTVRAARSRFCTRRSSRCRRPGVVLRVATSEQVRFRGTLTRRGRRFGAVHWSSLAGESTKLFTRTRANRLLRPGRYTLRLRVVDHPEIALPAITFRVRAS